MEIQGVGALTGSLLRHLMHSQVTPEPGSGCGHGLALGAKAWRMLHLRAARKKNPLRAWELLPHPCP